MLIAGGGIHIFQLVVGDAGVLEVTLRTMGILRLPLGEIPNLQTAQILFPGDVDIYFFIKSLGEIIESLLQFLVSRIGHRITS